MQTKTAKDLPVGAEVQTFWTIWTKAADGWGNGLGDRMTDQEIDGLLANGAMLTRIPTGPEALRTEPVAVDTLTI